MRIRQFYILIVAVIAGLAVQAVLALPASAAVYVPQGIATSTNLLSASSASSINNFHYNISSLPATSSVRIQFSQDNSNWYSSDGTPGGWDTLTTTGGADLSLSALGWSGAAFYYKIELNSTTDLTGTPAIDDIRLDYTPASGYENMFVFDNYGNVGIDTSSPSALLSVGHSSQFQVDSSGAIAAVTGYTQGSGNFAISGAGTFSTGTGAISLNGATSVTGSNTLTVGTGLTTLGGNLTVTGTAWTATPTISGLITATSGFDSNAASTVAGLTVDTNGNLTVSNGTLSVAAPSTTGNAGAITANSLTTGTGLNITSTSTAGGASGSSKLLNLARSGANANASHTAYGLYSNVANTGTTSTNIGGYFSASGATNNYGLIVENGNVGIGTTTPSAKLSIVQTANGTLLDLTNNYLTSGKGIYLANQESAFTGNALEMDIASDQLEYGYYYQTTPAWTNNTTEANSSGGTAYTLLATTTDIFYFGNSATFDTLNFDIATAATSATLVWEYCSALTGADCTGWTPLTVTDGTTGFTADGKVTWTDPGALWLTGNVNSISAKWLRVSATALTGTPTAYYSTISMFTGKFVEMKNAGSSKFVITADGNVGIGTTTPAYTLDVNGNLRASLSLTTGINIETLTADRTVTSTIDKMYQYLLPSGANRIVSLATTTAQVGDRFVIRNNGAYDSIYRLQINQGATVLDYVYAQSIRDYIFNGTNWVSGDVGTGISTDNNVAVGYGASGYTSGAAVGRGAYGYNYGAAVGSSAYGYDYGAAVGYNAYGYDYGAAVGYNAYGYSYGTAVGYGADGSISGAAVGYGAASYTSGAAVGRGAYGYTSGAAVGSSAYGYDYGAAVGRGARGMRYGAAVGYYAGYSIDINADRYNSLVGAYSGYRITTGLGNTMLGYGAGYDATYSPTTGSYNTLIGYNAWAPATTTSNFLNIGGLIFGTNLSTTTNTISSGNVGIGTTTPSAKLSIVQTANGTLLDLTNNYLTSGKGIYLANQESAFTGNALEMDIAQDQIDKAYHSTAGVGSTLTDNLTEANSNAGTAYTLLAVEAVSDDVFFFGNSATFDTLNFDIATAIVPTGLNIVWKYASGKDAVTDVCNAWTELTETDGTTGLTIDGKVIWTDPGAAWIQCELVDGQGLYYYASLQAPAATNITTAPTAYYSTISMFTGKFVDFKNAGSSKFVITADGNVGIGTAAPGSKLEVAENAATTALTVTQSGTGNIIDLKYSTTSLFTLNNEDRLTLDGTLMTTMGALNTNLIDDMEDITDWTASSANTPVASETTKVKVNDAGMKITTGASSTTSDYVRKTYGSVQDWSSYGRIGFWIQGTQTGQIISLQFNDSTVPTTSDYNITINNGNEWQYEEWDISGITSTDRDGVDWIQFIIDSVTNTPAFYIDQMRLYNASSATNRMAEFFLDASGNLVLTGDEGVELGRTIPGSSLPSMKIGAATVEIRNPLDLQVEGDVGVEYNLAFLNNDTSYITSAGPLIISAGDSNSYENLTITTSGTGDIIIDIADSASGFKIVGTGGGVFTIDASGNVVIGGVNAVDADLTVKRNISTQGGNITIAKLATPANITVTPVGTTGATTYGYRVSAINGNGETLASATVTTATGNATLTTTNYNSIAWDAVAGATGYKIYGRTSGAELYMATASSPDLIYNDTGSATPSGALPTTNTTGGDITGILSFSGATNLTLVSDAITVTQTYHTVDEEGAAVDDLSTINGGTAGDILVLRGYDTDYAVTAKDGIGNLKLTADFIFTAVQDTLTLIFDGTNWLEISRSTNGADIAESYYAADLSIEAGDIAAISSTNGIEKLEDKPNYFIEKTSKTYDSKMLGIISTNPFMTMGGGYGKITDKNGSIKAETRSVALAGRAPAKVNLENGNVAIGDFLTSSSVPGVAMRATGSGRVVGRALEPFDGNVTECSVEVVKMENSESSISLELDSGGEVKNKEPETLRVVNCRKVPSEIGKVMTFIELGWQGGENSNGQDTKTQWLEISSWCVSIDENGEWKKVKKTQATCEESEESGSSTAPTSAPQPEDGPPLAETPTPEPTPEPTPAPIP